jgi:hypothetical protein
MPLIDEDKLSEIEEEREHSRMPLHHFRHVRIRLCMLSLRLSHALISAKANGKTNGKAVSIIPQLGVHLK